MQTANIRARMTNPAMVLPDAMRALLALGKSAKKAGVPPRTVFLVHLRASQINGCSYCVEMHSRELRQAGETDERIFAVAAWREAPYFTDAERAALALAEGATRFSDRADPPGTGRDLGGCRAPLLRACAGGPDHRDRPDQRLEPPHRHHQAAGGLWPRLSGMSP